MRLITKSLVLFCIVVFAAGMQAHAQDLQSPDWQIFLDGFGYSNLVTTLLPSPLGPHEILCGDWSGAVRYDGMNTPSGYSMLLPPEFFRPDFPTNSMFQVVAPMTTWDEPTNPVTGNDTGRSRIRNDKLSIEILVEMRQLSEGMAVGVNPGGVGAEPALRSSPYVLFQTYNIRNVSSTPVTNFAFYQFLHPHPNNDLGPNNFAVYDPTPYALGGLQDYRYDITSYGGSLWTAEGSDLVGFSSNVQPTAFGVGEFSGHAGEPASGLLQAIYADALPGTTLVGPAEVAGAMKWSLGTIAPGQIVAVTVAFWVGRDARPPQPPREPQPLLQAYPGDSNGLDQHQAGRAGNYGDAITAVPGVLKIIPGEKWANYIGAAKAGIQYGIKNVTLTKQTPDIIQCADVFPAKRISQQGTPNIRTNWPLMYEIPGTTWTLTILYGTSVPWDDDGPGPNKPAYVHTETWEWYVDATLESMKDLLALFHEVPFATDEVPLISDEVLYPKLLAKLDEIIAFHGMADFVNSGLAFGDFEMMVMDACIAVSPPKPRPTGPGTGIANSMENPACCKMLADAEYVGKRLGLIATVK